jgi:hypothetical protein
VGFCCPVVIVARDGQVVRPADDDTRVNMEQRRSDIIGRGKRRSVPVPRCPQTSPVPLWVRTPGSAVRSPRDPVAWPPVTPDVSAAVICFTVHGVQRVPLHSQAAVERAVVSRVGLVHLLDDSHVISGNRMPFFVRFAFSSFAFAANYVV